MASGMSRAVSRKIEVGNAEVLDPLAERLDRRLGQPKVLQHVEIGDQRRLLVDRHQPGTPRIGGRGDLALFAADREAPGGRLDRAGQRS